MKTRERSFNNLKKVRLQLIASQCACTPKDTKQSGLSGIGSWKLALLFGGSGFFGVNDDMNAVFTDSKFLPIEEFLARILLLEVNDAADEKAGLRGQAHD